jgi:hypothetical protein
MQSEFQMIKADVKELDETLHRLRNTMGADREKQIRLEERMAYQAEALKRAFDAINSIDSRVKDVELQEPVTKLVTRYIIAGAIGVIAIVGAQLFAVLKTSDRPIQIVIDDREHVDKPKQKAPAP